jgi:hypothetical protein
MLHLTTLLFSSTTLSSKIDSSTLAPSFTTTPFPIETFGPIFADG